MNLYLATENAGKVREMQAVLNQALPAAQVLSVVDLTPQQKSAYRADETGATYAANALIKAKALASLVGAQTSSMTAPALVHPWILAEDSGFEVVALGGEPGVYSARYGLPQERPPVAGRPQASMPFAADDASRCAKILAALQGIPQEKRRARFIACMVLLDARGNPTFFFGRKEGYVADAARGNQGFGYDPIFCPEPGGKTWGELGAEEKNRDSHRSRALELVAHYLAQAT